MMKRLLIFFFLLIALSFNMFSATINTTVCPTFVSGNTYVFTAPFTSSTCTIDQNNVTITSNGIYLDNNIAFTNNGFDDVTINNLNVNSFNIVTNSGDVDDMTITDNKIHNLANNFITHDTNGNNVNYNDLIIDNNFIIDIDANNNLFAQLTNTIGSGQLILTNQTITDNTILNIADFMSTDGGGVSQPYVRFNKAKDLSNNILDYTNLWDNGGTTVSTSTAFYTGADCVGFGDSNLITERTYTTDSDFDYENDDLITLTIGSCQLVSGNLKTRKIVEQDFFDRTTYVYALVEGSPTYFNSKTKNIIAKPLTLSTSQYINFGNKYDLDLDVMPDNPISVSNVNQIRLGSGNTLHSTFEDGVKGRVITSTTITETYLFSDPFITNWHLVSYGHDTTIDNIEFIGSQGGDYGFLRPSISTLGNNLKITNSIFQRVATMTSPNMPIIHIAGSFAEIYNNEFDIEGRTTKVFAGGGDGGHKFQNNTFIGAGEVFQDFQTQSASFVSIANNNKFEDGQVSGTSLPFSLSLQSINTPTSFLLNGNYDYDVICDRYKFNIGNWYDDISDTINCTDGNSDGLCDGTFLRSEATDNINDAKVIQTFPYDFSSYLGTITPVDICEPFTFNVLKPVNNTNYDITGTDFDVSWSYTSSAYTPMDCFMKVNDNTVLLQNVSSGQSNSYIYNLGTGAYDFEITCENDEITQFSGIYSFTINSGTEYVINIDDPVIDTNGGDDDGNGDDDTTLSGNGVQVGNDFALTGLFTANPEDSTNTLVQLYSLLETPLGWIIILAFLFIGFSVIGLIFAIGVSALK